MEKKPKETYPVQLVGRWSELPHITHRHSQPHKLPREVLTMALAENRSIAMYNLDNTYFVELTDQQYGKPFRFASIAVAGKPSLPLLKAFAVHAFHIKKFVLL